jgi:hypothetical protein
MRLTRRRRKTRIRANTNFSPSSPSEPGKAELEQLKAIAQALGQDVPEDPPRPKPQPVVHVSSPGENLSFLSRLTA